MANNRGRIDYPEVSQAGLSPEEVRDIRAMLRVLLAFLTPDELRDILRQVGSVDDLKEAIAEVEKCLQEWRFRRQVLRLVGWLCVAIGSTVTALAALKSVLPPGIPW